MTGRPIAGLDRLEPAEAREWTRRLESTAHSCGCKSGALMTLLALVGWPAWVIAPGGPQDLLAAVMALAAYPVIVVTAGFVGKVAGMAFGRRRHRSIQRQLAGRLARLTPAGGN